MENKAMLKVMSYITQAEIARHLGIRPAAVLKWRRGRIPAERCLSLETLTQGKVTRHEMRPDVFGSSE